MGWAGRVVGNLPPSTVSPDPVSAAARRLRSAPKPAQPTAGFEGVDHNKPVPMASWPAPVKDALQRAGGLLQRREAGETVPALAHVGSTDRTAPDYDGHLLMVRDAVDKYQEATHLFYLLALYTLAQAPTYAALATLFAGVVEEPVLLGPLKGGDRAGTKAAAYAAEGLARPCTQWVADFLRVTVKVDDHTELAAGFAALEASAFKSVVVKDRRDQPTADVLVVVAVPPAVGGAAGLFCEVQFHFQAVLAVKSLLHFAYDVARCPATDLAVLRDSGLFAFPAINLQEVTDWSAVVQCKLRL